MGLFIFRKELITMSDVIATITNIGVVKVIGAVLIVALFVTAFTHGERGKTNKKGPGDGNDNK